MWRVHGFATGGIGMRMRKKTLVGAAVAAAAALAVLNVGAAQAAAGKDAGAAAAKVDQSLAPDRAAGVKVASSAAATSALAAIQARIAGYVAAHGSRYTFGSYLDAKTGKVVLDTDAPANVVSSLTTLAGAATAQRQVASPPQLRRATATDTFSRRGDIPPDYGGRRPTPA